MSETADGGCTTRFEYGHFDLLTARTDPGGARYNLSRAPTSLTASTTTRRGRPST
ncbi:hypothetical protein ACH41E_24360 [Streptomyces sp. NPDC020412]|uniref:hypothetical protein n=1 Tax=Streptomyces sp. NPDC020412 TaxID=3365073 RepID=UPI0037AA3D53